MKVELNTPIPLLIETVYGVPLILIVTVPAAVDELALPSSEPPETSEDIMSTTTGAAMPPTGPKA